MSDLIGLDLLPHVLASLRLAMRLGFNWKQGPFQLLDRLGVAWFVDSVRAEGRKAPPLLQAKQPLYQVRSGQLFFADLSGSYRPVQRAEGLLSLADIKPALLENPSASLWVLSGGDGDITRPLAEDDLLALERAAFLHLVRLPGTLQRLEHMLKTGKPLRN